MFWCEAVPIGLLFLKLQRALSARARENDSFGRMKIVTAMNIKIRFLSKTGNQKPDNKREI